MQTCVYTCSMQERIEAGTANLTPPTPTPTPNMDGMKKDSEHRRTEWLKIIRTSSSHTVHLGDVLLDLLGAPVAVHGHLELHGLNSQTVNQEGK
jgi:hypothetical protein